MTNRLLLSSLLLIGTCAVHDHAVSAARGDTPAVEPFARPDSASATRREYREVTIPAGTILSVRLDNSVASDSSRVEERVRATTRRAIVVDGSPVIPAGTPVYGSVTNVQRSGRVKGRANIGLRFHSLLLAGENYGIATRKVVRVASATKSQDAAKIVLPAAGGAIIGGIADGGKGAAIGGAVGGGAGTAVVLSTRGNEVRLPAGTAISVRLVRPVTVRVPV